MSDKSIFAELSERLAGLAPAAENVREDLRSRMEQALRSGLADLDMVSREDFDAQLEALERAQSRIDELEQTVAALESRFEVLESSGSGSP